MLAAIVVGIGAFVIIFSVKEINKAFGAKTGPGEAVAAGGCSLIVAIALSLAALIAITVLAPVLVLVVLVIGLIVWVWRRSVSRH